MDVDRDSLKDNYASKSDDELLRLHANSDLTDLAYECLESELAKRDLQFYSARSTSGETGEVGASSSIGGLDAQESDERKGGFGKRALAQTIGIVAGIVAWIAIGAVGQFIALLTDDQWLWTAAAWIGMLGGAGVWAIVSDKLRKKWSLDD